MSASHLYINYKCNSNEKYALFLNELFFFSYLIFYMLFYRLHAATRCTPVDFATTSKRRTQ